MDPRRAFALVFVSCLGSCGGRPSPAIRNELPPRLAAARPCASGAYYRKLVSPFDTWNGISADVTLPTVVFDSARRDRNGKLLDNASVYLGGRSAAAEIDCGLSWEVIREPDGSVSAERKAFRPFWRNKEWHTAPARADLYFAPGDRVRVIVEPRNRDKLTMTILRAAGLKVAGGVFQEVFSVEFDAPGFGPGLPEELKVVTAMDQAGNEGRPVAPSSTRIDGIVLDVALIDARGITRRSVSWTDMRCPAPEYFDVEVLPGGSERVGIHGDRSLTP